MAEIKRGMQGNGWPEKGKKDRDGSESVFLSEEQN